MLEKNKLEKGLEIEIVQICIKMLQTTWSFKCKVTIIYFYD